MIASCAGTTAVPFAVALLRPCRLGPCAPKAATARLLRRGGGLTYVLFVVFGISSWITINGIFAQLPLLVTTLPEGWALGSYLGLAVQAANLGPLLYLSLRRWAGFPSIPAATYGIMCVSVVSMGLLALTWRATATIAGRETSVALIGLSLTSALSDCSSSVIYWTYVGMFAPQYVSGLAVGESMSGVVAALLTALQRSFGYGPSVYFVWLALVVLLAMLAFAMLQNLAACRAQRVAAAASAGVVGGAGDEGSDSSTESDEEKLALFPDTTTASNSTADDTNGMGRKGISREGKGYYSRGNDKHSGITDDDGYVSLGTPPSSPSRGIDDVAALAGLEHKERALLLLVGWAACWQNGIVPATLSYATATTYSKSSYLWANSLSLAVDPLANLLPLRYRATPSCAQLGGLTLVWTFLGAYMVAVA
eukprot:COSAG05_NODE_3930_length_1769_cov_1.417964_1_plen_423_part_00